MRFSHARRAPVLGALGLAITLSLTACGGSDADTGKSANGLEKTKLTVAGLAVVDDAPLYIARDKGLFKDEGLKVNIKTLTQSTQAIPGLIKGDIDVSGGGNYVSFLQAAEKGTLDLRILAEGYQCSEDVLTVHAMPKSKIKDADDLSGKKIAVNIPNNIQTVTLDAVLKSKNVDPKSVKYVKVPFPEMGAALQKGQVDAAALVEPFISDAERKLGAHKVVDQCEGPTKDFPLGGYFAVDKFVKENPKTVAAFQRAIRKAQGMASDRKLVQKALPNYTKIDKDSAAVIGIGDFPTTLKDERLKRVADLMHKAGLLKSELDVSKLTVN